MTLPFDELDFDSSGRLATRPLLELQIGKCRQARVTDLIILAHGFRCDANDVTDLYTGMLETLSPHLAALDGRNFGVCGIYWPSKEFPESHGTAASVRKKFSALQSLAAAENPGLAYAKLQLPHLRRSRRAQGDFVGAVLMSLSDGREDPTEGLPLLHEFLDSPEGGVELLDRLRTPVVDGNVDGLRSGVDTFLNFMTWAEMKRRSGAVGATGLTGCVLAFQRTFPSLRIHLVGHSLGARVMAACCKSLAALGGRPIDSLSLLEGAFSHFGFSPDAGWGQPGFFRDVITGKAVCGPIVSTFSKQDTVLGLAYAAASRLSHDRLQAIGDGADPYGGIGHNGAQRTPESATQALHLAGQPYTLRPGIVTCLDGSGGLIAGHSDVTNSHVTYAIASAIGATS